MPITKEFAVLMDDRPSHSNACDVPRSGGLVRLETFAAMPAVV